MRCCRICFFGELAVEEMFLQKDAFSSDSVVVLTTHERFAYFSAVLQGDVDARFNPKNDPALDDLLHNVIVAGGKTVVIDEDYFMSIDDLIHGLERFVDNEAERGRLDIIVVCSRRSIGDRLLAFLVMYCGIYDIIFDKQGTDITVCLERMLKKRRARCDVHELVAQFCWSSFWQRERIRDKENSKAVKLPVSQAPKDVHRVVFLNRESSEVLIDVEGGGMIGIQFKIRTIKHK